MPVSEFLVSLPPTCISVSPTGDKPWYLCRGKFAATTSKPSTWGNQRRALLQCHQLLLSTLLLFLFLPFCCLYRKPLKSYLSVLAAFPCPTSLVKAFYS